MEREIVITQLKFIPIIGFLSNRKHLALRRVPYRKESSLKLGDKPAAHFQPVPVAIRTSVQREYPATETAADPPRHAANGENFTTTRRVFSRGSVHKEHRPATADSAAGSGRAKRRGVLRL